jgi:hypothetical protein
MNCILAIDKKCGKEAVGGDPISGWGLYFVLLFPLAQLLAPIFVIVKPFCAPGWLAQAGCSAQIS